MKNTNIEVEGGEILIQSKEGHYAIIPAKHRQEIMDMIKDGCDDCINNYIQTLPKDSDYAEDGSLLPDWDKIKNKIKATLNPKNWGVPDYTDKGSRAAAYAAARKAGEKEFMWNNKRFNTKYDGTTEQQLKETGITDNQIGTTWIGKNLANNLFPAGYSSSDNTNIKKSHISTVKRVYNAGIKNEIEPDRFDVNDAIEYPEDSPDYSINEIIRFKDRADYNNLYFGLPQKYNTKRISKYKPSITKDDAPAEYYTSDLIQQRLKELLAFDNLHLYRSIQPGDISNTGNYILDSGEDDRGKYYSFYDKWDLSPFGTKGDESMKIGKPIEIYDRIYYNDYETGRKQMYYSDKELSELDVNKKNFDTLALQRELNNRGYKLPKSVKKDGTFDGIWGDEIKNALLDYQIKNKKNEYKPLEQKDITSEYKPYTAVQDNTYVAPKVILPLEKKKEKQFIPRERPVLRADTRTEQQRKKDQEYTESVLNPSIRTQIGEAFQKPLRWLADPVKGVGDIVSAIAPKSALAKDLPNTNEDSFKYRKKQLNPYTSNKEKINNTINEAVPLTNWASLNILPVEAAAGNMIKSGKNLIKPASKVLNKTDDVGKNLPKLEQIPLDFKIEDVLKNISSTERKNMEIIKKGNAYFKELDNPESLKRLKEFGDEYNIDLLDAYKKAGKRWDYGKNIGGHSNFKVKKTDKDWYGLSTIDMNVEDRLKVYDLEFKFGKDSKQVKDFYKKLSQEKSINYISDVVPLDRYEKTIWHELSHDINKSIIDSSPKLQEDIKNIFIKRGTADLNKVKKGREYVAKDFYTKKDDVLKDLNNSEKLQKIGENEFDYVTRPTETWAFLSTNLRQDLKNTGVIKNYNELLTSEKLEQAIKNGNTVFSRFEPYIKDKDAFIKLFNKMTLSIAPAVLYFQSQNRNKTKNNEL